MYYPINIKTATLQLENYNIIDIKDFDEFKIIYNFINRQPVIAQDILLKNEYQVLRGIIYIIDNYFIMLHKDMAYRINNERYETVDDYKEGIKKII